MDNPQPSSYDLLGTEKVQRLDGGGCGLKQNSYSAFALYRATQTACDSYDAWYGTGHGQRKRCVLLTLQLTKDHALKHLRVGRGGRIDIRQF